MESLEVKQFKNIYFKKKVLITGHNGFKGSWLNLWLKNLGAVTYGISDLKNHQNSFHFDLISNHLNNFYFDLCNYSKTEKVINKIKPDIIFHLAAQPYVLTSLQEPHKTLYNNFLSTLNILEIYRNLKFHSKLVLVTSDKVYENKNSNIPFNENDRLGGLDPYSCSKSVCENIIKSYEHSFFSIMKKKGVASVRAGNVIGGGDWGSNRIIPDYIKSIVNKKKLSVRSPESIRPWQYILDCLSGYLLVGQYLLEGKNLINCSWNFGPKKNSDITVRYLIKKCNHIWSNKKVTFFNKNKFNESKFLKLSISKSKKQLGWKPIYDIDKSVFDTINWYKSFFLDNQVKTNEQLNKYFQLAINKKTTWISN